MTFVELHHDEIKAIVRLVGGRICRDRGWEVDDLEADVCLALIVKQRSPRSAYDPTRGTVDYYLRRVVRSAIGHRLDRIAAREAELLVARLPEQVDDEARPLDEVGVDDAGRALLAAVLVDARRALFEPDETAYQAVVGWLMLGRDFEALSSRTGVAMSDLVQYLQLVLGRLLRRSHARWRVVWKRHHEFVKRARTALAGHPPPH